MDRPASKLNGTRQSRRLSSNRPKLAKMLSVMCLLALLPACQTTSTTETTREGRCAAWRAITYSAKGDTKLTVDQIRTHNLVGRKLGCWK